jgi:hypothetical protein
MKFALPKLNAFAKAQAWGMALGFALALLSVDKLGFGLPLFFVGWLAAWVGWEFFFARSAPSERKDMPAMVYGIVSGFILPWFGLALSALFATLRP